ncbi:phosphate transport system regulatory protein PhoU [Lentzea flava]|uniref:Phosphate transport system regulatory protein PhoU n=2 Tax=Lentzea flava TaxID=103732 RepID=A0ABQ2VK89_9PSEU|nr:phosphate transport system regulatory protein PhoU [Lentzea flava]
MCALGVGQLRSATDALVRADLALAKQVVVADRELDAAREECEHDAQALLALQAPVAHDLRAVLAVVYCADRLERMGDLARHVAESACRAYPHPAAPVTLAPLFVELGRLTVAMAEQLQAMITEPGGLSFELLRAADAQVDRLHRGLMARIGQPEWTYGVAAAVEVALLARFYERFGDHVVAVARRLDFVRTGEIAR